MGPLSHPDAFVFDTHFLVSSNGPRARMNMLNYDHDYTNENT